MSGAADLMPRIEEARSGHQRAEELLSEAKGMLGHREEAPKPKEEGGGWLDMLKGAGHTLLDAAGFIPVVGAAADLANAAWYAAEGDYTNAAFSAASAVPGVGDALAAGKVAVKVAGATGGVAAAAAFGRRLTNAADTATDADKASDAVGAAKATFGHATSNDYRKTFFTAHPGLDPSKVTVHHAVEQGVLKRYPGVVSEAELHSLENLRGIPNEINSRIHLSEIRKEWNRFYKGNPTATKDQLLEKATEIDGQFGHKFNPPIR